MSGFDQFKDTYIAECYEMLEDMEQRLINLDEGCTDSEELNAIFRCAHSIKGGAGAFGFDNITRFTHVLENLLDSMREGKIIASKEAIDLLLKSGDVLKKLVDAVKSGTTLPEEFGNDIKVQLAALVDSSDTAVISAKPVESIEPTQITVYDISFIPFIDLFNTGNEPLLIIRELKNYGAVSISAIFKKLPTFDSLVPDLEKCFIGWKIGLETTFSLEKIKEVFEFVEGECELIIEAVGAFDIDTSPQEQHVITPNEVEVATAIQPVSESKQQEPHKESSKNQGNIGSIRVDIDKIDKLVNMVGELVITQSMIYAQARALPTDKFPELMQGIEELSQHSRALQESVMAVRMQPVKSVFARMNRIVRDLAAQLNKEIRLELVGENTEVDKTVIEQLSDPITHMIRNSVDHGIESIEKRLANNKNKEGVIHLSAAHRGGRIVIEIKDDGAGINRERVLAKAKEKGLIAQDAVLTNTEIDHLLFLPGFSTAETVTNVSGRGVGMDVVKKNIMSLGGKIEIDSVLNEGSTFTVSLPLTLAILDAMIIKVGDENYIIPIANIIETLRPKEEQVKRVAAGCDVINVRGEYMSVVYLGRLFSINNFEPNPSKALIVLVENGQERFGLVVDELIGQQQVVIKSLEPNSKQSDGISGATILGDGKVSLILDIGKLQEMQALSLQTINI